MHPELFRTRSDCDSHYDGSWYSTLCRFGRWHDQLITNKCFFFQSTVLASESSALFVLDFFVDISLRLKFCSCDASCTL